MRLELPESRTASLLDYEPASYWAVWQHPEGRYAYSVASERESWLMLLGTREAGEACLLSDARQNERPPSDYRLDELTLPEAFAAVRAQPLPFLSTYGHTVRRVNGVMLIAPEADGWATVRCIPL